MLNLFRKKESKSDKQIIEDWINNGKPVPPPHVIKQQTILAYKTQFKPAYLVETGTYLGDMVYAMKDQFEKIYSIELSEKLHLKATKRFKNEDNINLLQGDSGSRLSEIVNELDGPALFWLDGHYSGGITALGAKECPVPEELDAIFISKYPHIILIDDARMFNGTHHYPTIEEIKNKISRAGKNYSLTVEDDIIRLVPNT